MTTVTNADQDWMLWVGLGITALFVVIAIIITVVVIRSVRSVRGTVDEHLGVLAPMTGRANASHVRQPGLDGRMALADVTSFTQTGTEINHHPLMVIGLRVGGDGIAPFDVQVKTAVPISHQALLHRRRVAVRADLRTRVAEIDWQATAAIAGSVPMTISSEDGTTYDLTGQAEPLIEIFEILRRNGIPTDGSVDLRSNPEERDEVSQVARRYSTASPTAGTTPIGATGTGSAKGGRSLQERLAEIEQLKATGVITEAEYATARRQILSDA
ncbi:SHOCT domain-containing protein [Gordonia sp. LSe1-13]|uniref:SHOCT domain-containing protein n=1 Tax=Gordonia sesuvii TaxID=3116777 RepID=A0ABU7MDG1_9ACTN|nr:SHOCT domain-containing protein [Gordonia sp. LSe1-13]